jgi:hypothetical protein
MYVADIRSSRTFVFFRTGTAAWHRLVVVDDLGSAFLSTDGYIYMGHLLGLRVSRSVGCSEHVYLHGQP